MIKSLDTFVELAKKKKGKKISIAAAEDSHVLEAMKMVLSENLAEPIFVGHKEKILKLADEIQLDISNFDIVNVEDPVKACYDAVKIVHDGSADVLMRGLVDSKYYLRAIFDKEIGLKKSKLVSQVAFIESPNYHKVFAYTDSGINIAPTLQDKITMINHAVEAFHNME